MADLTDAGYLSQPHTSAGRIPTMAAFRSYAQSVGKARMPGLDIRQFHTEMGRVSSLAERVERSSHFLTEFTRNVGIAAAIPSSSQALDQIELLKLADRRVLMIVVTRDHAVHNRVVLLDEEVGQDELNSIRNYVNRNFSCWALSEARAELERRLQEESATFDEILKRLTVLYGMGLFDIELAPELFLEGASNLVSHDLQLTREKMRELFRALEEKKRILELLDRFLEQRTGELEVHVGLGDAHPSMEALALIGLNVTLPGGVSARIAVLGPIRMHYDRVMSAVWHVGQAFQNRPV